MTKGFYYQFARLAIRLLMALHEGRFDVDAHSEARVWLERTK